MTDHLHCWRTIHNKRTCIVCHAVVRENVRRKRTTPPKDFIQTERFKLSLDGKRVLFGDGKDSHPFADRVEDTCLHLFCSPQNETPIPLETIPETDPETDLETDLETIPETTPLETDPETGLPWLIHPPDTIVDHYITIEKC